MRKSEYANYIASEAWLQRRKGFLLEHSRCNRCGLSLKAAIESYDQGLHIHHKNYQRVGCELDSDLEALCRRCHEIETFGRSDLPPAHLNPQECAALRELIGAENPKTRMTKHGLAGVFA